MFRKYLLMGCILASLLLGSCGPRNLAEAIATVAPTPALALTSTPALDATLPLPPVALAGTELRSIQSTHTGRD